MKVENGKHFDIGLLFHENYVLSFKCQVVEKAF